MPFSPPPPPNILHTDTCFARVPTNDCQPATNHQSPPYATPSKSPTADDTHPLETGPYYRAFLTHTQTRSFASRLPLRAMPSRAKGNLDISWTKAEAMDASPLKSKKRCVDGQVGSARGKVIEAVDAHMADANATASTSVGAEASDGEENAGATQANVSLKEEDVEVDTTEAPPTPNASSCGPPEDKISDYMQQVMEVLVSEEDCGALEELLGASLSEALTKDRGGAATGELESADQDPELRMLQAVVKSGAMPSRTPADQRWRRAHPPGSDGHAAYAALKTNEAKAAFKVRWATSQYEELKRSKQHIKTLSQSEKTRGRMVTFGALVAHYGGWGWKDAVLGARATAGKCAKLGGKWCKRDPFSNLLLFRVLEEEDEEEFKKSWSEAVASYSKTSNISTNGAAGSVCVAGAVEAHVGESLRKAKATAKTSGDTKTSPRKKVLGGDGEEHDRGKLNNLMKEATKIRSLYQRNVSSATALRTQIANDETWSWARASEMAVLDEQLGKVEGHITHVTREFLFQEVGVMRKRYTEGRLIDEVTRLLNAKTDIIALGAKRDELMRMQRARAR